MKAITISRGIQKSQRRESEGGATEMAITKSLFLVIYVAVLGGVALKTTAIGDIGVEAPIFIFGDSTLDVGTNNHLVNCTARADHPYYGVDFIESKPTGRFSNGLNTADTIVRLLGGYELSPEPFLTLVNDSSTFKQKILEGVNFASGGGGLFRETGQAYFGEVISFEEQIQQFATVRENITESLGESEGDRLLQDSLYIMSIGFNDIVSYLFNRTMTPEQLIANLTAAYATHLQNLYKLGARKFGIISIPALGCTPVARSITPGGGCDEEANGYARDFYTSIESLLKNLSSTSEGFKYSLANAYNMTMNTIQNPQGFKDVTTACCGNTTTNPFVPCEVGAPLCSNRNDYLFWDAFHPTQAGSILAARVLVYTQDPEFMTPLNFSSLRRA